MSADSLFLLPYCSGAIHPFLFAISIASLPYLLLCIFASIPNRMMGLSSLNLLSLAFLCIRRSVPCLNLVGQYPVHHVKLDAFQFILEMYGSTVLVLTMAGVTLDGPDKVDFQHYSKKSIT